jgi:short-subunit dehydrogenase
MLEVNLRAPIALARALVPAMINRRRGHLVFISSLNGRVASPQASIYSAAKFGLRGFALGLRQDLRPHGVGVSVVMPGFVSDAGMFADAGVELPPGVGTRTPDQVAQGVLRAVERNLAEVDVAPLSLRLGTRVGGVAPGLAATVQRLGGGDRIASSLASGHRRKLPGQG